MVKAYILLKFVPKTKPLASFFLKKELEERNLFPKMNSNSIHFLIYVSLHERRSNSQMRIRIKFKKFKYTWNRIWPKLQDMGTDLDLLL